MRGARENPGFSASPGAFVGSLCEPFGAALRGPTLCVTTRR